MKKLMLMLGFFAFVSIVNVSAQSCSSSKKARCAKKTETSSASTTAATTGSEDMVKKVACTSEAKACCSKGDKKSCAKKESGSCGGKMSDATVPSDAMQIKTVKAAEEMKAPTANQK